MRTKAIFLTLLLFVCQVAVCRGVLSGQPKLRAVHHRQERILKVKATKKTTTTKQEKKKSTPQKTSTTGTSPKANSEYSLPTLEEAYNLFTFQEALVFWEIIETNATDVSKFLDSQGRATGVTKVVVNKLKALLLEDILALEEMQEDEFILTTLMRKESLLLDENDDEEEEEAGIVRMLGKEDDVTCILAIVSFFIAVIDYLLGLVGLDSVGDIVKKFGARLAEKLASLPLVRRALSKIFQNKQSTMLEKIGEAASVIQDSISFFEFLEKLLEEMSFFEKARLIGSIVVKLSVTWVSIATPAGAAAFFVKLAKGHYELITEGIDTAEACTEKESVAPSSAPIQVTSALPSKSPTITPSPFSASPTTGLVVVSAAPTRTEIHQDPTALVEYSKEAKVTSDPHFRTWNGGFSYQGACDLVYILTGRLRIHLRLDFGDNGYWSYVSSVAFALGNDVIEYQANQTLYVNGVMTTTPPAAVGGTYPLTLYSRALRIDLAGGQYVAASLYQTDLTSTLTVSANGFASEFGDSIGLAGSFHTPIIQGRSGETLDDITLAANEWKVNPLVGDPDLFVEPSPFANQATCQDPLERPPATAADREAAEIACAHIVDDSMREDCIFDVLASGDTTIAENPAFTEVYEPLQSICVADDIDGNNTTNACSEAGGFCVWRCNTFENTCLQDLCSFSDENFTAPDQALTGMVEGCSCAVPNAAAPTASPTPAPTENFRATETEAPSDTFAPTEASTTAPPTTTPAPTESVTAPPTTTPAPTESVTAPPTTTTTPVTTASPTPA